MIEKKFKKPSNIGIKLADIECQMTGQNVQPLASNKNPERGLRINQVKLLKSKRHLLLE